MKSSQRQRFDVSTVVSILPVPINEKKPGLNPGQFDMRPANDKDFQLLVIERCHHPVYIDETRPRLIVPDPSDIVAESIVTDYKVAMVGFQAGECEPGLGWVPGEYNNDENGKKAFAIEHSELLEDLHRLQLGWFRRLLEIADDDWSRYKQHKFITPLQRIAAEALGQTNREWLLSHRIEEAMSKCKFCFTQVHPLAIICHSCRGVLDPKRFKEEFMGMGTIEKVEPKTSGQPVL